jgi:integrase
VLWPEDTDEECPRCGGSLAEPNEERRRRWSSGFDSSKKAHEEMRAALHRLDTGSDPFPADTTVAEFVEGRWLPHLEAQRKPRESTRRRYEGLWRVHLRPVLGPMRLNRVRPAHVQQALDVMLTEGAAARSVAQARAVASAIFKFAVRSSLITTNSARETSTPAPQAPDLVVPDSEQLHALIEAARKTQWEVPALLAATTGARRSEVLAMRWENVELDRARVRIVETLQRRKGGALDFLPPKTARGRREVPIPAFLVDRLREHRTEQKRRRLAVGAGWTDLDLVCDRGAGQPIDPDAFSYGFTRIRKDAGLEGVRLHDLRHAVATELARRGVSPTVTSRVLGHASEAFTMATYQHPDERMMDAAADALGDVFEQ